MSLRVVLDDGMATLQSAYREYGAGMELFRDREEAAAARRLSMSRAAFNDRGLTGSQQPGVICRAYLGQALCAAAVGDYVGATGAAQSMMSHVTLTDVEFIVGQLQKASEIHRALDHENRAAYLDRLTDSFIGTLPSELRDHVRSLETRATTPTSELPRGWKQRYDYKGRPLGDTAALAGNTKRPVEVSQSKDSNPNQRPISRPERVSPGD